MDRDCAIVRDLLPLYAEELCCPETAEFVKEHASSCPGCSAALEEHLKPAPVAPDTKSETLHTLRNKLRKRTVFAVISAVLLLFALLTGVAVYATVPVWLSVDEAVVYAEQQVDGSVKVKLTDRVCQVTYLENDRFCCQGVRVSWLLDFTRSQIPTGGEHSFSFNPDNEQALWYSGVYTGDADTLLWGSDIASTENSYFRELDRSLLHILYVSILVGMVLLVCGVCLRKKLIGKWLLVIAAAFICCALSTLFVSGGHYYDTVIRNAALLKYSTLVKRYIAIAVMTIISFTTVLFTGLTIYEYRRH